MNSTDYKERTLFVSNVDPQVTEGLLYELFLQAGPLCKVVIPKSKPGVRSLKAFVTFKHVESTPYALAMLHGILLFGKPLQLKFYRGNKFETQRRKILQNRSAILHGDEALSYRLNHHHWPIHDSCL
ncbi:RNA-binding protein 7-like isoform X4 [Lethenteron reissneri]|uniref:RNA-binding protein 7-like isoform X4 n=1 Tax=Lethenteron reissneri TaxID=7753 RepID=UPI002AB5FEE2|nr:RNA-binding protein 7-like isoform X4 [Lethenteron reissneri]